MKHHVIWTKAGDPYCMEAVQLLIRRKVQFEERQIGVSHTFEQFHAAVPNAQSLPQLTCEGKVIGGLEQIKNYNQNG